MKVTVGEAKNKNYFPCLMAAKDGQINLMTAPKTGMVLAKGEGIFEVGHYSDGWGMEFFEPFDGPITLEND